MSKYTTEVRFICEQAIGLTESAGYSSIKNVLSQAAPKVFDFEFPIFDEAYRLPLETKILRHFYTREICEETVGLWKLRLEDRMNTIMPYYNQLYKSELLEFNPLYDVDITRDHNRQGNSEENKNEDRSAHIASTDTLEGESHSSSVQDETGTRSDVGHTNTQGTTQSTTESDTTGTRNDTTHTVKTGKSDTVSTSSNKETQDSSQNTDNTNHETVNKNGTAWKLYSDTPQGGVDGIVSATDDIALNAYLTNATKDTEDTTTETDGTSTQKVTGKRTTDTTQSGNANMTSTDDEQGTADSKTTGHETGTASSTDSSDTSDTLTSDTTLKQKGSADANTNQTGTSDRNETGNTKALNTLTSTEDYIEHVKGKQGSASYSKLLNEFRQTFLNIDAMILENLCDLFFGLW